MARPISVIIPASNEEALIGPCLDAVIGGTLPGGGGELIVVANGCRDRTVSVAQARDATARARGWDFRVLDLPQGSKIAALNAGDAAAHGATRLYLDADVTVSPPLIAAVAVTLAGPAPAYASGQVRITARGPTSRAYARLWARVPFMSQGVPGCGLFAVNAAGRARWGDWPAIIADDTFARLQFAPDERLMVPHPYDWPIAEGFGALTRVRRRQDRGVGQIAERFPVLLAHDDKRPLGLSGAARLALSDPWGFAVYTAVALRVRASRADQTWTRGR